MPLLHCDTDQTGGAWKQRVSLNFYEMSIGTENELEFCSAFLDNWDLGNHGSWTMSLERYFPRSKSDIKQMMLHPDKSRAIQWHLIIRVPPPPGRRIENTPLLDSNDA
jgi:hypothetical protein